MAMTSPDPHNDEIAQREDGASGRPISLLEHWARTNPERDAVCGTACAGADACPEPSRLTWGQLAETVGWLAARLQARGLSPGAIVAVQLPHGLESVITLLALWQARLLPAPLPAAWRERDIEVALDGVPVAAVIGCLASAGGRPNSPLLSLKRFASPHRRFAFGAQNGTADVVPLDPFMTEAAPPAGRVPSTEPDPPAAMPSRANEDIALLHFTTRRQWLSVIPRGGEDLIAAGLHVSMALGLGRDERILCPYPVSGITGIAGMLMPWLVTGSQLVLHMPSEIEALGLRLERERITYAALPARLIPRLALDEHDLSALRILGEVSVMPPAKGEAQHRQPALLERTGKGRHMLNIADIVLAVVPDAAEGSPASLPIGVAAAAELDGQRAVFLETRIQGSAHRPGTAPVLSGYLALSGLMVPPAGALTAFNPAAQPLTRDGFLVTGLRCSVGNAAMTRLACLPDPGLARIGGLTLDLDELDRLYASFPSCRDAAAFTIADPLLGERLCAAVVLKPGAASSRETFLAHLRRMQIAPYLMPQHVITVGAIPRDAEGRVLRAQFPVRDVEAELSSENADA